MSGPWVTVTSNGARYWVADDREHAIEQHTDAFGDDPSERVIWCCDVGLGEAAPALLSVALELANDPKVDLVDSERRIRLYHAIHKATGGEW